MAGEDIERLRQAALKDPAQTVRLADALVANDRAEEAVHACRSGLHKRPDDIPLRLALGRALSAAGHLEEAQAALLDAVSRQQKAKDGRGAVARAGAARRSRRRSRGCSRWRRRRPSLPSFAGAASRPRTRATTIADDAAAAAASRRSRHPRRRRRAARSTSRSHEEYQPRAIAPRRAPSPSSPAARLPIDLGAVADHALRQRRRQRGRRAGALAEPSCSPRSSPTRWRRPGTRVARAPSSGCGSRSGSSPSASAPAGSGAPRSASSCWPRPSSAPMCARSKRPTKAIWRRATRYASARARRAARASLLRDGRARRRAPGRRSGRRHRRRGVGHAQARRARAASVIRRDDPRADREMRQARALMALERGEACTETNPAEDGDIAARCALQKGDVDGARKILSQTIAAGGEGKSVRALLAQGSLELGAGDLDAAQAAYGKVLALYPQHPRALVGRTLIALERNETPPIELPKGRLGPTTEGWFHLAAGLSAMGRGAPDAQASYELDQARKGDRARRAAGAALRPRAAAAGQGRRGRAGDARRRAARSQRRRRRGPRRRGGAGQGLRGQGRAGARGAAADAAQPGRARARAGADAEVSRRRGHARRGAGAAPGRRRGDHLSRRRARAPRRFGRRHPRAREGGDARCRRRRRATALGLLAYERHDLLQARSASSARRSSTTPSRSAPARCSGACCAISARPKRRSPSSTRSSARRRR